MTFITDYVKNVFPCLQCRNVRRILEGSSSGNETSAKNKTLLRISSGKFQKQLTLKSIVLLTIFINRSIKYIYIDNLINLKTTRLVVVTTLYIQKLLPS